MKRIIKIFFPLLFMSAYFAVAYIEYVGVDDATFRWIDIIKSVLVDSCCIYIMLLLLHKIGYNLNLKNHNLSWLINKGIYIICMVPGIIFLAHRIILLIMTKLGYTYKVELANYGDRKSVV